MAEESGQFGSIYNKRRVLITGHTGFKGSWLSLWLTMLGAEVVGFSLGAPTEPNHFETLKLPVTTITGTILNREMLLEAIRVHKPEIIFHLAAQPIVRKSYGNPVETFETNIIGTVNVLECCRIVGTVAAVINVTSDKCYENTGNERAYNEGDPLGGDDPYSASKGAAEIVSNAYRKSFFTPEFYGNRHSTLVANVRAGNVIGGGDWAEDRLIPDLIRSASAGATAEIRNPRATRPWQHVLEPLSGYLLLGQKLLEGKPEFADNWNFGPEDDFNLSVLEVTTKAQQYWDAIRVRMDTEGNHPREAHLLMLDSAKARSRLGWRNVWNPDTTFKRTIGWYREYYASGRAESAGDLSTYSRDAARASLEWASA